MDLSEDQLDEISGGWGSDCDHDYELLGVSGGISTLRCKKCGYEYRASMPTPPMVYVEGIA